MSEEQKEFYERKFSAWMELQKDLVQKSSKGKHVIAADSRHMIPHDQPQIIVERSKK